MRRELRLKEVEIEGFRSFTLKTKVDMDYDIVLLLGGVGSGKSSLMDSIAYALFGTTYDVRERKSIRIDDLINDFADEAYVRLKLKDERGNDYEIIRRRRREGRTRAELLVNGKSITASYREAEERIQELLGGVTFEEFYRYVFIRREVLEAIIYGQPLRRSEAIDRLFGIAALETAFRLLPLREVEVEIERHKKMLDEYERNAANLGKKEEKERELKEIDEELRALQEEERVLGERRESYLKEYRSLKALEQKYLQLSKETTRLEGAIEQLQGNIADKEPRLILEKAILLAERLRDDLLSKMTQFLLGDEAEKLSRITIDESNISHVVTMLREALDGLERTEEEYRRELMNLSERISEIRIRYEALRGAYEKLAMEVASKEEREEEYKELIKEHGDRKVVTKRMRELEEELEELRHGYEYRQALYRVISYVLRSLREKEEIECPICLTPLNKEKHSPSLERRIEGLSKERDELRRISRIEEEIHNLRDVIRRLNELEVQISDLEEERMRLRELEERIEEERERMDEMHDVANEAQVKLRILAKFLSEANRQIRQLEEATSLLKRIRTLEDYRKRLRRLREELASLGYDRERTEILAKRLEGVEAQLKALRRRREELQLRRERITRELEELKRIEAKIREEREKLRRLEELMEKLRTIKYAYRRAQSLIRKRMLSKLIPILNDIFRSIYPYDDYDALDVKVEVRRTSEGYERSIYEIMARRTADGKWVPVLNRLSDGQKTLVALTFIIALSRLRPHNLNLLILDEPTPNIDFECRRALIETLTKAVGVKQLIIATQNLEYLDIAKKGSEEYGLRSKVYKLRWTGRQGTVVEELKKGTR